MIVNTINKAGSGGNNNYVYSFQEQNWEAAGDLYLLRRPTSLHTLGTNCYVVSVEKEENASFVPTMFTYDRYANGLIEIQSEQIYDGRAILQEGAV